MKSAARYYVASTKVAGQRSYIRRNLFPMYYWPAKPAYLWYLFLSLACRVQSAAVNQDLKLYQTEAQRLAALSLTQTRTRFCRSLKLSENHAYLSCHDPQCGSAAGLHSPQHHEGQPTETSSSCNCRQPPKQDT